jgi:hypothetical protein
MSTTALIVEIVIIGLQVLVWVYLVILLIFGRAWLDLSEFKEWTTIISLALVATSYTIGIIFNSLIGAIFFRWEHKYWTVFKKLREPPVQMRAYIMIKNKDAFEILDRNFNRSRLLRATAPNLLVIGVLVLIFVFEKVGFSWRIMVGISFSVLLLAVITFFTWIQTLHSDYFSLAFVYETLKKSEGGRITHAGSPPINDQQPNKSFDPTTR